MKRILKYGAGIFALLAVAAAGVIGFREAKDYYDDWYIDQTLERTTPFPATEQPDQICLTWASDPRTTQTIQWRTSTDVTDGVVQWRAKNQPDMVNTEETSRASVEDKMLKNDPVIHRFTATVDGLLPATAYEYRAGSASKDKWSDWYSFTTAPDGPANFSFVYQGDPQLGLEYWGKLIHKAQEQYTNAAFHVIAGDLVNSGSWRNEWDRFFDSGRGVFDTRPLVPVLGNHDYDKKAEPRLYLDSFALGTNGPKSMPHERAYSFCYANSLFVILDSNEDLDEQTPWLEEQLSKTDATWKFVVYHHPAYSSAPNRDNRYVRRTWGALFDKYHVDIALQGHDHAYLRTYPLKNGERVASAKDGTYYIVSVSGTKYYEQEQHDYAKVAFANVSTFQIIDITTNPDRLVYRCIDFDGKLRDEFIIEK